MSLSRNYGLCRNTPAIPQASSDPPISTHRTITMQSSKWHLICDDFRRSSRPTGPFLSITNFQGLKRLFFVLPNRPVTIPTSALMSDNKQHMVDAKLRTRWWEPYQHWHDGLCWSWKRLWVPKGPTDRYYSWRKVDYPGWTGMGFGNIDFLFEDFSCSLDSS